ncbi:peptidylprolyl isomerase [Lacticaseibacillus sharpeae]|uniref:Peptidyl-prolyl cis-trans isomerase n=1 Tax=Lacticaseibacillus sharpeae JCM 1186 = DSM 20505 TaxID=1291052 RepID=A0A0R1ZRP9_9LACO|nr:peptidylprolyl isomerase [Lacticaseibacillus sharpeae]KRM54345.1 peptidyl-prolyl cis-trans isomerase [Lacticaseibacillus sharpeae JCM 1186 = DSM 20505]
MTYPQLDLANHQGPTVTLNTNHGDIVIALFPDVAPKTVANFVGLTKKGYYDGIIFHRVIPDFMIQGGDPTGTGMGGESIYGDSFEDEFSNQAFNLRGALSMANAGPNTNGSQFFIVQNKNINNGFLQQMDAAGYPAEIIEAYKQGGTPWLDHRHTVFGQVMTGMDVVDEIAGVKTLPGDKPAEDVTIISATVTE